MSHFAATAAPALQLYPTMVVVAAPYPPCWLAFLPLLLQFAVHRLLSTAAHPYPIVGRTSHKHRVSFRITSPKVWLGLGCFVNNARKI